MYVRPRGFLRGTMSVARGEGDRHLYMPDFDCSINGMSDSLKKNNNNKIRQIAFTSSVVYPPIVYVHACFETQTDPLAYIRELCRYTN